MRIVIALFLIGILLLAGCVNGEKGNQGISEIKKEKDQGIKEDMQTEGMEDNKEEVKEEVQEEKEEKQENKGGIEQYMEMIRNNQKVLCNASGPEGSVVAYYMGDKVRVIINEVKVSGAPKKVEMIKKDGKIYIKADVEGNEFFGKNCDWIVFSVKDDEVQQPPEAQTTVNANEYSGYTKLEELANEYSITCRKAHFSETIFEPKGNICDVEEQIKKMYATMPGYQECKDLPLDEFQECLQQHIGSGYPSG